MNPTEQPGARQGWATRLLTLVCAFEGLTGLALLIAPNLLVGLLLGARLEEGAAIIVARIAGSALIALAIACWPSSAERAGNTGAFAAMLAYNLLATIWLSQAVMAGVQAPLLLLAAVLHVLVTAILAYILAGRRS